MAAVSSLSRTRAAVRSGYLAAVEPSRLVRARGLAAPLSPEPLVSIPIATFDRPDIVIGRTLPALLSQSYQRIEVILVGDGCVPDVAARLDAFQHPKVRFVNLRRRSRYPNDPLHRWMVAGSRPRNRGARLAQGEVVVWMSDDDLLYPTAIEGLVTTMQDHDAEVVLGIADLSPELEGTRAARSPDLGSISAKVWAGRDYLRTFRWSRISWMKHWNRPCDYDLFARMQHAGVRFARAERPVCLVVPVEGTGLHGSDAWRYLDGADRDLKDEGEG